jgi:hypothetical protein
MLAAFRLAVAARAPGCPTGRAIAVDAAVSGQPAAVLTWVLVGVLTRVVVTTLARVACVVMAVLLLVLLVLLVLLAMRVFAWAGRGDPMGPAAVTISRMPQASATHADQVRTRMVPSLSFQRIKR